MKNTDEVLILDTDDADVSQPIITENEDCIKIRIVIDGSYDGKLTFVSSDVQKVRPDFSQPASDANPYSPIQVIDNDTGNAISGSTGVTFSPSGSEQVFCYEYNTNGQGLIGLITSGATGGKLKAYLRKYEIS
jgi:hypothetical protein